MCSDKLFFRATDEAMQEYQLLDDQLLDLLMRHEKMACLNDKLGLMGCPRCHDLTGDNYMVFKLRLQMSMS